MGRPVTPNAGSVMGTFMVQLVISLGVIEPKLSI